MIKDSIEECLPHKEPLKKPDYTEAEVQSIRACWRGEASERQQRMAIEFILRSSAKDDISHRPGDPYGTAFAEGKRFVGLTLVWMLFEADTRTDPDKIAARQLKDDPDARPDNR